MVGVSFYTYNFSGINVLFVKDSYRKTTVRERRGK